MSKQVRLTDSSYEALERLSKQHERPLSQCLDMICDLFEIIHDEVEKGCKVVVETPGGQKKELLSPILRKKR